MIIGLKGVMGLTAIVLAYFASKYYPSYVRSPVIESKYGKLQGIKSLSRNGREYYSYFRIPFAKPPVGNLRFDAPQIPDSWEGVRDASSYGPKCLQLDIMRRKTAGDEDCLFLNVFTPKIGDKTSGLPVLFFIHGGIFITGSSNEYEASYFMDEDIILVTINYRLAALGFLNTGDEVVRGNMGLKDQVMALKWVQQNIEHFGGDPKRVTIFGESAGGASVHFHLLSRMSKGLFSRAISQSGTAVSHWAISKTPKEQTQRFAGLFGCLDNNSLKMVKCLRNIPAFDFVEAHKEVLRPLRDWITVFAPSVEVETVQDENTFLSSDPIEMIRNGEFYKVPWMAGINSHEGLLFSAGIFRNDSLVKRLLTEFDEVVSKLTNIPTTEANSRVFRQLEDFYVGKYKNKIGESDPDSIEKFENYTHLFSDRSFIFPNHQSAKAQSIHSPVYLYYYNYRRDVSIANFLMAAKGKYPIPLEIMYHVISTWVKRNIFGLAIPNYGVCHADELGMQFPMVWDIKLYPGTEDYKMSQDIIKLWISFAYDKPLNFRNVPWAAADPTSGPLKYLRLDNNSNFGPADFANRMEFWEKLEVRN